MVHLTKIKLEPNSGGDDETVNEVIPAVDHLTSQIKIKQEDHGGDRVSWCDSEVHSSFTISPEPMLHIKKEGSCASDVEDALDTVHHHSMTSLSCQVKIEPESEDEEQYEQSCDLGNYPLSIIIKPHDTEGYTEGSYWMDDEVNWKNMPEDRGGGAETNPLINYENNHLPWNIHYKTDIKKEEGMSETTGEINKQHTCRRNCKKKESSQTQCKTLCHTKKRHTCSSCGKAFNSRQICLQHMWDMHTVTDYHYSCEVCGKKFKNVHRLQIHEASHSIKRPYPCNMCEKAFKLSNALRKHKMSCHSNERPFSCDLCVRTFKLKEHLNLHKTTFHSDERPYPCDLCEKTFKLKDHLNSHRTSFHSNERPFACDQCEKAFKRKDHLQDHKELCHSDVRPYSCDLCEKAFKRKSHLLKHKGTFHSNKRSYSCDLCEKTFKVKDHLRDHKVACHSSERAHTCDICGKSFKLRQYLVGHKKTHKGEKPKASGASSLCN